MQDMLLELIIDVSKQTLAILKETSTLDMGISVLLLHLGNDLIL